MFGASLGALAEAPLMLADPPYTLSPRMIGVVFLGNALTGVLASPLGGWLSDTSAAAEPAVPQARLRRSVIAAAAVQVPALLLLGWSLQHRWNLALVVLSLAALACGSSFYLPSMSAYVSTLKQECASTATASMQFTMMVGAGALIIATSSLAQIMGCGWSFTTLAGASTAGAVLSYAFVERASRRHRNNMLSCHL
jgi:MFS family permease